MAHDSSGLFVDRGFKSIRVTYAVKRLGENLPLSQQQVFMLACYGLLLWRQFLEFHQPIIVWGFLFLWTSVVDICPQIWFAHLTLLTVLIPLDPLGVCMLSPSLHRTTPLLLSLHWLLSLLLRSSLSEGSIARSSHTPGVS